MSEAFTPPAAPAADQTSLDAGQVASMRDAWITAGHDAAKFDEALAGGPAPAGDEPPIDTISDLKTATLSEGQAQELADALRAAGVPDDQIAAAMEADGFKQPEPDTRTDDEKTFDEAFGGAKPADYKIDFVGRIDGADVSTMAAFNTEATTWLSAAGFPPTIGPSVVERAMDVSIAVSRMSAPEKELWFREQTSQLERQAGGPEAAEQVMACAAQVLARGDKAFAEKLFNSGAVHDAFVLMSLGLQGARLQVRAGP